MKRKSLTSLVATFAVLLPLSLFADSRPHYRTDVREEAYDRRAGFIDGIVRDVRDRGRHIVLSTSHGTHSITANGGTRVHYRGRSYRTTDLDRGDRVRVTLAGNGKKMRARSIEVLRSASHGYGAHPYDDRYEDRGRYDDRYPYGNRDDRNSRFETTVYGIVTQMDRWDNRFLLRSSDGRSFWVDSRTTRDVNRLQVGDRVMVRGMIDRGVFRATDVDVERTYRR